MYLSYYLFKLDPLLSIKKNLAYNFLLSASQVLLPLISIPYISRVLTPEGIGRVSFIDSFTWYFISIAEFGIVVYGMREVARQRNNNEERGKLVSELLALHVVSSALALVLYFVAVFLLWNKIQDIRLLLFSLSFLLVNFFACEWYFLGMERFKYLTLRSLLTRLLGLFSIFILIKSPDDYFLYYAITVVAAIVNSLWNNYLLFKEVPVSFKKVNWKKHIVHTRVTYLISLLYGVTLMLDNVLLRLASTATAVGYYAFSMKIARTSSLLLTDSLLVFFPRIVSLIKEGTQSEVQQVVKRNLQLLIFFGVPLCTGLFLLAEPLVIVFLGPQFIPAVIDLRLLAFFPFLKMYNLFLSKQLLIAHNQEKLYVRSLAAGSLLFVVGTLLLSYYFADVGACIAILVSETVTLLLNGYYARKTVPYVPLFDSKSFWQACAGVAIFIPAVYFIQQVAGSPLTVLLVSVFFCFAAYMALQGFVLKNEFTLIIRSTINRYIGKKL